MKFYEITKPIRIRDFVPDSEGDVRRLEMLASNQMVFPSPAKKAIILHGKYGTGKTELARLLPILLEENRTEHQLRSKVREMTYRDLATFISCQSNNSSMAIHQAMPTSHSFNYSGLHYVILDEVDNIRADFQKSMKSFITEHSHVIFIMTTNHIGDVDEGLKSRSHLISFENPSEDLWLNRLSEICASFHVACDPNFLQGLIASSKCDARTMLSELEEYIQVHKFGTT